MWLRSLKNLGKLPEAIAREVQENPTIGVKVPRHCHGVISHRLHRKAVVIPKSS